MGPRSPAIGTVPTRELIASFSRKIGSNTFLILRDQNVVVFDIAAPACAVDFDPSISGKISEMSPNKNRCSAHGQFPLTGRDRLGQGNDPMFQSSVPTELNRFRSWARSRTRGKSGPAPAPLRQRRGRSARLGRQQRIRLPQWQRSGCPRRPIPPSRTRPNFCESQALHLRAPTHCHQDLQGWQGVAVSERGVEAHRQNRSTPDTEAFGNTGIPMEWKHSASTSPSPHRVRGADGCLPYGHASPEYGKDRSVFAAGHPLPITRRDSGARPISRGFSESYTSGSFMGMLGKR